VFFLYTLYLKFITDVDIRENLALKFQ